MLCMNLNEVGHVDREEPFKVNSRVGFKRSDSPQLRDTRGVGAGVEGGTSLSEQSFAVCSSCAAAGNGEQTLANVLAAGGQTDSAE